MVKVTRRGDAYIFHTSTPWYKFDNYIGDWCKTNNFTKHYASTGNGTDFSIDVGQATDERLAYLMRVLCQMEIE